MQRENGSNGNVTTMRLDLPTKLALIAAFLYDGQMTPEQTVELAVEIEQAAFDRVKRMKRERDE